MLINSAEMSHLLPFSHWSKLVLIGLNFKQYCVEKNMKQIFPFTPKRHDDIIRGNFSLDVTLNNPCFQRNEFSFCMQNISINLLSNFNIYLIYVITHFLEQNKLALKQKPNSFL